jgi:acetyl-CoA C-acetyltransferase
MQDDIVLVGATRTPIGRFGGELSGLGAADLGVAAASAAIRRSGVAPDRIDQAIFGHARQAGGGPNVARQISIRSGLPVDRPAYTVNQACLSGMQAILGAVRAIRVGEAQVVLAGGTEAMSQVPYLMTGARFGMRMGHQPLVDAMYRDGYHDPLCDQLMGRTAETLADQYSISRGEQDAYAARSQQRCEAARKEGRFGDEIAGVEVTVKRETKTVATDGHPRDGVTAEALGRLPAAFRKDGTVTAGNSSGITDGAAAVLVMSRTAASELGAEPMACIVDYRVDAVDPAVMGLGPVPAVRKLLEQVGTSLDAIDLVELNEAFAAQVIAVDRELGFDPDRLNVNGGAIALGHPSGCSGARIVVTLLHEMARRGVDRGLATACVSGGMGGALLVEREASQG